MPKGNRKGAAFEREICVLLSRWWSKKQRDDLFWRTSQSGGRATTRSKKGKTTSGAYGDVTAVDLDGMLLMKWVTIELKRGKSHGNLADYLDGPGTTQGMRFRAALDQARFASMESGSRYWMLIARRDRRKAMVYIPWAAVKDVAPRVSRRVVASFRYPCTDLVVAIPLFGFLQIPPENIIKKL